MKVINDNETKDDSMVKTINPLHTILNINIKKLESIGTNWTSGIMNEYVDAVAELFNGTNYRINTAVFTQLDKKLGKRINLSLGARYEQFMLKQVNFMK